MTDGEKQPRPGDAIIDRYMPDASDAEREEARENLYAFVGALLRIVERRVDEDIENGIRAQNSLAVELDTSPPL